MNDSVLKIIIPKNKFNCVIQGYNIPHKILRQELSFEVQGSEFSEARKNGYWDGFEYLYDYNPAIRNEGNFPFGLLSKVINILNSEGCSYEIFDERSESEKTIETKLNVQLREYQQNAVNIAIQRKYGILNIATGGGKCVSENTLIPTNYGILPISYFKSLDSHVKLKSKSDYVYTDEIFDGGLKNTVKIKTESGYSLEGTYNHPILVLNEDYHLIFKPIAEIDIGDIVVLQYNSQLFGTKHPLDFLPTINVTENFEKDFSVFLSYFLEYGELKDHQIVFDLDSTNLAYFNSLVKKLYNESVTTKENQVFIDDVHLYQSLKNRTTNGIPLFVLQLQRDYLYEFTHYYIHHFKNEYILSDLQVLLLNFGVISKLHNELDIINKKYFYKLKSDKLSFEDAYLYAQNSEAENVIKNLITLLSKTILNFNYKIKGDLSYKHIQDILKQNQDYDHYPIYKSLAVLLKDYYFFDSVQEIDYSYGQVYDFVVPHNHSFIANGFVNHNTKTSTGIIHRLGRKTVFYVHTIDLLDQAKEEFEKTLAVPIGQVGGGVVDIQDITVATIQTVIMAFDKQYINNDSEMDKGLLAEDQTDITNYKEDIRNMVENAEVIFFDECQHLGAESFYEIAKKSYNASFRYGLSATPWRDDGKELYIEAGLGEIICSISASWLIDNGHLVQPHIKYYDGQQPRRAGFDKRPYQTIYKEDLVENEKRNRLIVDVGLAIAKKGKTNLIIIQQKKHGEMLQKMFKDLYNMDVPFVHGGNTKKKRRAELAKFKRFYEPEIITNKDGTQEKEKISPIMIASTIADEGLDIPHLASVTLAGGGKSTTRILQRVGRAIRLYKNEKLGIEKTAAFVVDFIDNSKYLFEHSMVRRSTMQKEKSFIFK